MATDRPTMLAPTPPPAPPPSPRTHVAIVLRPYLQMILTGRKTIECRLTRHPIAPFNQISPGDRIFFKASSGPYMATACVQAVDAYQDLTITKLRQLYRKYNPQVCGSAEYWQAKKSSRFATFIHLTQIQPTTTGPKLAPSTGQAWFILPPPEAPEIPSESPPESPPVAQPDHPQAIRIKLTEGAIRNRYLRIPAALPTGPVSLILPHARIIHTQVTPKRMIQWRRWNELDDWHKLEPGDVIQLQSVSPQTYQVILPDFNPMRSTLTNPALANSRCDLTRFISEKALAQLIRQARDEDMGPLTADMTSQLLIPPKLTATALLRARQPGYLAGAALFPTIARIYDRRIQVQLHKQDGDALTGGDTIATFTGPLRSILAMERIALNFSTHLSGIATLTAQYVALCAGTRAAICDTRKTIPGLRALEKYAVTCGQGQSHRMGLHDAVLVKDNHIAHIPPDELAAQLQAMMQRARAYKFPPKFIQIEVDTLAQLERILPINPDMVLLDNMTPALLTQAVKMRDRLAPKVLLEASGGVNLKTVAAIARTGVDRISVGALTHSAPSLDLGLDID